MGQGPPSVTGECGRDRVPAGGLPALRDGAVAAADAQDRRSAVAAAGAAVHLHLRLRGRAVGAHPALTSWLPLTATELKSKAKALLQEAYRL